MENTEKMRAEKVSVCPVCYEYVTLKQAILESEDIGAPVVWKPYCPRCKVTVLNPKMMDIKERLFLNVRAMRKAKEVQA